MSSQSVQPPEPVSSAFHLVVVAPTFYADTTTTDSSLRYNLGLAFCRQAAALKIQCILVDASPDASVRQALSEAGAGWVQVVEQTVKGRKGAALRQALQLAYETTAADDDTAATDADAHVDTTTRTTTILCFQEPEKVDMLRHWKTVAAYMIREGIDICNPRRQADLFQLTYPVEQYHSENFVNLYLDALASSSSSSCTSLPSLDWTMGPIALQRKWAPYWQLYDGELWDAQMVPMIRCHKNHGATIGSCTVQFALPAAMRTQEQGSAVWCEKRLAQINHLVTYLAKEFKASDVEKQETS